MDKVLSSLSDWIKSIIKDTLNKLIQIESENDNYPELMDITRVYQLIEFAGVVFAITAVFLLIFCLFLLL